MPNTIPSEGTLLGIGDTSSVFTNISGLKSIDPPGGSVPSVDKTKLASVAKEKRPGLIPDAGQFGFRFEYDPNDTDHQDLYALVWTPVTKYWQVTYNDGHDTPSTVVFQGFITEWEPDSAEDESNIEVDVTVEITGVITSTAGTSA